MSKMAAAGPQLNAQFDGKKPLKNPQVPIIDDKMMYETVAKNTLYFVPTHYLETPQLVLLSLRGFYQPDHYYALLHLQQISDNI
ncbi:hypothetical protein KFK09_012982 [Dendrobium nobile]|uniref:Uncharacterized protein n=1 Tax=Dendrobium nobile TaxID=94219 RepID=A0A8T3BIU8_DENNO|nr:hypothetical protein KFK09_012982 [Dendrobium nobile]